MGTVERTLFELARLQRIYDLSNGNRAMTMACMEAVALERRIAALERGLPPPARDRIQTGPVAVKSWSRPVDVSALGKLTGRVVDHLAHRRALCIVPLGAKRLK